MKKQDRTTFSRRNFMKTSALAGGGILIGFNFFSSCKEAVAPPVDVSKLNFQDFNAFIKIAENGYVTIFSPNPEIGQGVKTSMPMIIAEELDVPWNHVTVEQGALDTKNFTRQVAGGSQSIRFGWDALRQTGATAKLMLMTAAANKWGVDVSACKASNGIITNSKGEELTYGDVVNDAATLEVPEDVSLKSPEDYNIIGKDAINVDMDKIIRGVPLFGLDYKVDGMKYVCVCRPPAFGQKIKSFDGTAAKLVNGVTEVIQFGDKVAVLADNTWAAMKGKQAVKVEWVTDSKPENTALHNEALFEVLDGKGLETRREDGNIKNAFEEADKIIERTYEAPFLPHNCMEPMNFYANVTEDKIHLVGPIQTPERTAQYVAKLLNRNADDIHLEMTRMGGGFGRRLYGDFVVEAAEISNITKQPIKVIYSREDDMTAGTYRPASKYRIKASIKDGEITGYHLIEAAVNGNMWNAIANYFPAGAIDNYKVETGNFSSNISTGAWRAPYTNFLAFAEQSFFDELALTLEKDPIQLRLDLLKKVPDQNDPEKYSSKRMTQVIKLAAEKSNWGKTDSDTFQGFASYFSHNTHVAEVVDITMNNGMPKLEKVTVAVDCGIVVNPTGAKNQIEGGVLDGIGHAMFGDFSFENGTPQDSNFNTYQLIRMKDTPIVETHFVDSNISPTGLGEPGLPPAGGALANAIKAATGQRILQQPFINSLKQRKTDIQA
ncbi:xanthine dehydrogenase family protein molybdopterin-binding subunit [Winogradskyella aurantia]|uniref:Isoquinoline 1-oxidoreductase n=1 Tax=Winogradskyella aurantia TaxID=1915063 RepID=A0A265UZI7_9FLAO|nr:molybdopterin cofactor-binding domain-containing protein [Winogradskyella aurantia]OZV70723.1 isoquinoline 1-oxidoreductase [Winogradskyella aurantia]